MVSALKAGRQKFSESRVDVSSCNGSMRCSKGQELCEGRRFGRETQETPQTLEALQCRVD